MFDRLYLVMRHGGLVVNRGAGGWSTTQILSESSPECVVADGRDPERVFVGTFDDGLLRSSDGGSTFERVGATTIEETAVMSVTMSPHDPDVVLAGTEPSALYGSADGGDTWHRLTGFEDIPSADEWFFPPRPDTHHVRWIEVDPHDDTRLYIGIEAGAFLLSPDGGQSWVDRPEGSMFDNHTLATHHDAPGRVYAAAGDGFACSNDGGASWNHIEDGLEHGYVWGMAVDPGDADTVIVSAASGARTAHSTPGEAYLYRLTDTEGTWQRLDDRGVPTGRGALRAVLASGNADGEFVAATDQGLYHSTDSGAHWHDVPADWPETFHGQTARGLVAV